ncbi:MAG: VCBS repeat-containing protein [Methylococcales bacterium]
MQNDGYGHFTPVSQQAHLDLPGAWMGIVFADFNSGGNLDMFATNSGDYSLSTFPMPFFQGKYTTRWLLGNSNGTFNDPGLGQLIATPFGWGAIAEDYDNDGDTDIIYHGGIDPAIQVDASNPGMILRNDGHANFSYDLSALKESTNHGRRAVNGVAAGDLNNDGFIDIVSVSMLDLQPSLTLQLFPVQWGSKADATALYFPAFLPTEIPGEFIWSGKRPDNGTLSIEINSANNNNHWASVKLLGTKGLTSRGRTNRDAIGVMVFLLLKKVHLLCTLLQVVPVTHRRTALRLILALTKNTKVQ